MFFFLMIVLATSMPLQKFSSHVGKNFPCKFRMKQDIKAGTFRHMESSHETSTSNEDCNEQCLLQTGCVAWVRRRSDGLCWMTNQTGRIEFEAEYDRDSSLVCPNGCVVKHGQDIKAGTFNGMPISGHVHSTSNEDCNEQCFYQTGCTAWVRQPSTGLCWMSDQAGTVKFEPAADRDSGLVCCVVKHGYDTLAGSHVHTASTGVPSTSNANCNKLCTQQTGCVAWVRQPSTGLCWMSKQTGTVEFEPEADRDSGLVCRS